MRWEFKLPDIGEGVTEGEIVAWHIRPGDFIKEDDPMVDVMTDKATVTITSPRSGTISETRGAVAHRGLRQAQALGRATHAARTVHLGKQPQQVQVDVSDMHGSNVT